MRKIIAIIIFLVLIVTFIFVYKKITKTNQDNNIILTSDGEFLLYIDGILEIENKVAVIGTISKGSINTNNEISIVGLGKKGINTKVIGIKLENEEMTYAYAGDRVSITLDSNVTKDLIAKGQAIITPESVKPIYNIDAKIVSTDIELSEIKEKGNIFYINENINCSIDIKSEEENLIKVSLDVPLVVAEGIEFKIKNDESVIAHAIVLEE